ncbi:hypothetical protein ACFL6B_04525 [Thermodesulfobacteriota bacterium]
MLNFSGDTSAFIQQITSALHERSRVGRVFPKNLANSSSTSAVLFLLGRRFEWNRFSPEPCLILNRRSIKVKQPGDLCCPGGSIIPRLDSNLAKILYLPLSPLARWPYWHLWRQNRRQEMKWLALLFATGLRESFEEMRLNPLGVKFLGTLPSEQLIMFRRTIYPMVCWIPRQKRFYPNWEVESIIYIPIKNLLDSSNYARYRLRIETPREKEKNPNVTDYPCFVHEHQKGSEVLWGATFRITMTFLETVFGFKAPDIQSLSPVHGTLDENYLTGI